MRKLCALGCLALLAAGQEATFRVGVSLVHVDVEVRADDGRIVEGLTRDNFRVLDNRKEQPIVQFAIGDEALDLILLFDISGSMKPAVEAVAAAAREGLRELQPGDRVAVMVFNAKSRMIAPFTTDLDAVQQTIQSTVLGLKFSGATFLQSAAEHAAKELMKQPRTRRRRAVLAITDNYGQRTRKEATVVNAFWEADALLSALIVRNAKLEARRIALTVMGPQMLAFQVGLGGVAEKTGGDMVRGSDPGAAFREAMRRIRTRYSLYYPMPESKPGELRSVTVQLTEAAAQRIPKARIRARTGYRTPTGGDVTVQ
jgi:VWFA-related protein